jgi:hypothetical protein
MSFDQLPTALIPEVTGRLLADQTAFEGEKQADQAALSLVLGDIQIAEAFVSSKTLTREWENADNNYRAFGLPKNWPSTESPRAGLCPPVVMEAVEKLMPTLMLAFFSDSKPFLLERMGKTTAEVARMWEHVLAWAVKESGFKEGIRQCLKSALLYGMCFARWGWKTEERKKKTYHFTQDRKVVKKSDPYEISHPTFENIEIRKVLVDPSLREQDCRKGRWVAAQIFTDANGLDELRNDDTYKNIPTREQLREILSAGSEPATDSMSAAKNMSWRDNQAAKETDAQSVDPLKQPLELLEYVAGDRVIVVLQRKIVIRNDFSGFDRTTFLSCAFIDVPGSMYGFGVSKLLGGEQYLQTDVLNKWLDGAALQLNPAFTAEQGLQTTSQQVKVSTGKILTGPKLTPIPVPDLGPAAMNLLQTSENRAARRVGANGGSDMPTQAMRTAEGVNAFGQDVVNKTQYFIEIFSELVFIPALEAFIDICKDRLQPEDVKRILSDADEKIYNEMEQNPLAFYSAECNINVLASTKLAARRNAAQLLPLLMNLAAAPNVQDSLTAAGMKFNYKELLDEAVDLTGWDIESLITKATPEEIKRAMAIQAPQPSKAEIDAQSKQQDQQNALGQIEEAGVVKAGVKAIEMSMKHAMEEGKSIV